LLPLRSFFLACSRGMSQTPQADVVRVFIATLMDDVTSIVPGHN
jgi:hypothetical protein